MILLLKTIPSIVVVLWKLGWKVPKAFAVIRLILAVLGSAEVLELLELIGVAAKKETETLSGPPDTERDRIKLFDRIRQRFALNQLGMTETQYVAFCNVNNVSGPIIDEQLA